MITNKHEIYAAWAPAESPWSPWVKTAVFAHIPDEMELLRPPASPVSGDAIVAGGEPRALVVDLPGPQSVATGLALAARGYRPVPLFNSCPPTSEDERQMSAAAVDARAILEALVTGAAEFGPRSLPVEAPPVFLVDSRRDAPGVVIAPRVFDNRAVVFAADFPSAQFLRSRGILRARVIHDPDTPVGNDLRHALSHWVTDGIAIEVMTPDGASLDVAWPRAGFFGELAERWRALFTLQRGARGGFGRLVPEASGG